MKSKHLLVTSLLLGTMLLPLSACGPQKEIASIGNYKTLYQYQIDEIWLISDEGKKLETYTDCDDLFYFSDTRGMVNQTITSPYSYNSSATWWAQEYFSEIELKNESYSGYSWYSEKHETYVDVLVTFEKVAKAYTPSYTIHKDLAEIEYTKIEYPNGSSLGVYKEENILTFKEYEELQQNYQKEIAGIIKEDKKYIDLTKEYEEKLENIVVLKKQCVTMTSLALTIENIPQ